MSFDCDLIVIGAGSGGLAAAERASAYGMRVAIAECSDLGGACINYGCIPEKLLDYAASFARREPVAVSYGWSSCDRRFDWSQFIAAKEQHIRRLHELHLNRLQDSGVQFLRGRAAFIDAHTLVVADRRITSDKILIAVGAQPVRLEIPGIEYAITWRELYRLPKQPKQIAILGGDPIGVKIAGSLNALGSQVTQIIPEERILPELDAEIGKAIQERMIKQGVRVLSQTRVEKIQPIGDRDSSF
jgi:glutathione reductase (NADPH)